MDTDTANNHVWKQLPLGQTTIFGTSGTAAGFSGHDSFPHVFQSSSFPKNAFSAKIHFKNGKIKYTVEVQVDYSLSGLSQGYCFSKGLFHQQFQGIIRL